MARLKEQYKAEVAPALMKQFGYKSVMQIPKIDKVVINVGCGEARSQMPPAPWPPAGHETPQAWQIAIQFSLYYAPFLPSHQAFSKYRPLFPKGIFEKTANSKQETKTFKSEKKRNSSKSMNS